MSFKSLTLAPSFVARTTSGSSSGDLNETVHRFGNIGVTTFEKIIHGYRNSAAWCAFEEVIFPEVNKLFLALM